MDEIKKKVGVGLFVSVILAAGEGTRMKSKYSKVGQKILNKPMIEYVLEASKNAGVEKNIIIVGRNKDYIEDLFGDRAIYREQKIGEAYPYGTGYAVSLAVDEIGDDDDVLILNGDCPLLRYQTLKVFMDHHKSQGNVGTIITAMMDDPTAYGRIIKDDQGYLKAIVEEKDASEDQKKIKETNSGIYIFNGAHLKASLEKLDTNNAQGEAYVTDVVGILASQGEKLGTFTLNDNDEVYGINSKDQLSHAQELMRARVNKAYMREGVIMENPSNIFIEPGVEIGRDTYIGSGTKIVGKTIIGEDCRIEASYIKDSEIGDFNTILSSQINASKVHSHVNIGPYAQLRPGSELEDGVKIGNFVEVKNSLMRKNSKASHHAYIGDADVGENVNIGCGVVFANYDGRKKHSSLVGKNSFIGSNSTLVAPIHIEEDVFVGADSTVTRPIKAGSLYITRAEIKEIENWVYRKRGEEDE